MGGGRRGARDAQTSTRRSRGRASRRPGSSGSTTTACGSCSTASVSTRCRHCSNRCSATPGCALSTSPRRHALNPAKSASSSCLLRSAMQRAIVLVVGAALISLALLIMAPASLIDGRLDALSAGRLRLANASGTLWNGAGDVRVLPGNTGIPVSWRIDAWPLLWGELRGTLSGIDDAAPPASFMLSARESTVRNVAVALPAGALLRAAGAPVALATAGGNVSVRISELTRRGERID